MQSKVYFGAEGTSITNSFTASSNGDYTVYARDSAGNDSLYFVTVTGIDREAPSVSLSASTTNITNTDVTVIATAEDNIAISKLLWAEGLQDEAYFQADEGTPFTNQFLATANGVFTVYVEDTAGNYALATITVSIIFKQAPQITLVPYPDTPTRDTVYREIDVDVEGEGGNELVALRFAEGEQTPAFFSAGGGEDVINELEFEGSENGIYSVYARDTAGNETVATITISNIDRIAPNVTLTANHTAPTQNNVTVTVNTVDNESGIREVRWSAIEPQPDAPWLSNELENGQFIAEANGTYTVIAFDNAGNETKQQINITNIVRDTPTLLLSPDSTSPVGEKVTVTVAANALGNGNDIDVILWAAGDLLISFFHGGLSEDITDELSFDVTTNGTYTVYTRDLAGNETVQTIEIDNIRSMNASLATLVTNSVNQLSPSFTPEQLHYTLQVGSNVQSILLEAEAEHPLAAVTVNGSPLAIGNTMPVLLNPGVNTIRILVTAELTSVEQTYTIEVTRERAQSTGNTVSSAFGAKLNGKLASGLNETVKTDVNGRLLYELELDDATSIIALAQANGKNELRIEPNSQSIFETDSVHFKVSPKALAQLKEHNVNIILSIGTPVYELPIDFSVVGGGELSVNVRALRANSDTEQLLSSVVDSLHNEKWQPKLVGVPVAVTTNVISDEGGTLLISLPEGLNETELRKLAVFVEGDEGQKGIKPATIRYDANGQAIGIALAIDHSGRVIILQAEPVVITYDAYIEGYANGGFAPEREVTRAELAVLLMKLSVLEELSVVSNAAYADVPASHWASAAIVSAATNGWMSGLPDGLFHPSNSLTRAELASVLMRWRDVQAEGLSSFEDANSHWASAAIAASEQLGWMTGYEDGSFRPGRGVTRAEVVTILNRVLGRPAVAEANLAWSDVSSSHWAAGDIGSASQSLEQHYYLNGEVDIQIK